jgi:hypothetical protein
MSSYSPPVLGLDTYTPQTPTAHTVEQPSGLLGMAFTPEAIEARRAQERFEEQLIQRGGLKSFAVSDPERFNELFPNVVIFTRS